MVKGDSTANTAEIYSKNKHSFMGAMPYLLSGNVSAAVRPLLKDTLMDSCFQKLNTKIDEIIICFFLSASD